MTWAFLLLIVAQVGSTVFTWWYLTRRVEKAIAREAELRGLLEASEQVRHEQQEAFDRVARGLRADLAEAEKRTRDVILQIPDDLTRRRLAYEYGLRAHKDGGGSGQG